MSIKTIVPRRGRYSYQTLKSWKKEELIEYIRILEENEIAMAENLEQQAVNFLKMLDKIKNYKYPIDGGGC